MRFLRHLATVCLIVAAVTGLGLAWNHFAASTLVGGLIAPQGELAGQGETAGSPPPGRVVLPKGTRPGSQNQPVEIQSRPFDLGLSSMFQSENLPYLRHTVVIETGLIAAVVIVDASRRRARRADRAMRLAPPPDGSSPGEQDE